MVSREGGKCVLTNSESDSEVAALPAAALEAKCSLEPGRQVRKRNKALQVRFKDICEAQNEQRETTGEKCRPAPSKGVYRKYMTVPARRSIPNVTRSTGVQTSPDLRKRYQTFPFERKKGHTIKHVVAVESFKVHNNGFVLEGLGAGAATPEGLEDSTQSGAKAMEKTQAMLHTTQCVATVERHPGGNCLDDSVLVSFSRTSPCTPNISNCSVDAEFQICSVRDRQGDGLSSEEVNSTTTASRRLSNFEETPSRALQDIGSGVSGPIAWNSLTQVECLESPSARSKRKKTLHLNGLQSRGQCQARQPVEGPVCPGDPTATSTTAAVPTHGSQACQQIVPMAQEGDLKAQLQVMENLISSSQETIKVLLGVIQELEKGEAHREGVELDFKQQEDKLLPLMRKLCPMEDPQFPSLPYSQEAFTSTPKRKSKTESKKHARWKLWFL
ncbi:protein FAM196A-like [Scleropages formosus]|uniref:Protein FAM196A-like n=1 Tax=Scleropages formosus TaxID=113540 RepID=A0A0P7UYZ9_SCLFO|nr:protein FAM196A-like [Scleropages formosus]